MTENETIAEIRHFEDQRIDALLSRNFEKLDQLIDDDLLHVHANGKVETKAEYLDAVAHKYEFLRIERPSLNIRVIGDVAIVCGALQQDVRIAPATTVTKMVATATQVWRKSGTGWVQSRFQATRVES